MTVVCEKSLKIDFKNSVVVLFEAYLRKQGFVGDLSRVLCEMNSAKVNEIKRSATHNEQCVTAVKIGGGREIVDYTALIGELELAHSREPVVNRCGVRE